MWWRCTIRVQAKSWRSTPVLRSSGGQPFSEKDATERAFETAKLHRAALLNNRDDMAFLEARGQKVPEIDKLAAITSNDIGLLGQSLHVNTSTRKLIALPDEASRKRPDLGSL